jgi:hypothetical protein
MKCLAIPLNPRRKVRPTDTCGIHETAGGMLDAEVWRCPNPVHRGWRCELHWREFLGQSEVSP